MSEEAAVVSNSGPIIVLASIHRLDLLPRLFGTIVLPDAVHHEVCVAGRGRPGAKELAAATWAVRASVAGPSVGALRAMDLGRGESEAIALAVERRARWLLLDDLRARRVAVLGHGLKVKGSAGILVAAKRVGLVPEVASLLRALQEHGYHIGDAVVQRALREAGEDTSR